MSRPGPALGMDAEISRRDFLNGTLVASGTALLGGLSPEQVVDVDDAWTGYGGVGDYRHSNGNTKPVVDAAHVIRDTNLDTLPPDTIDTSVSGPLVAYVNDLLRRQPTQQCGARRDERSVQEITPGDLGIHAECRTGAMNSSTHDRFAPRAAVYITVRFKAPIH